MFKSFIILSIAILLLPFTSGYGINDFPKPFISFYGKDNPNNPCIVVGKTPPAIEIVSSFTNIYHVISSLYNSSTPCNSWVSCERRIGEPCVKLDDEIPDWKNRNIVSIGGPCANRITAQIMNLSTTWPECANDFENGTGRLITYNKWNKTQLIVAGYSAEDTKNVAEVLINYKKHNLSGENLIIDEYSDIHKYCNSFENCYNPDFKNVLDFEWCVKNRCIKCKTINQGNVPKGTAVCQAMPHLYMNLRTKDCLFRGCGYSPYTSPGEGWIRIN